MTYKENPKTVGSGVVCCIPQTGRCPNNCEDCFFQSGRSYLEPLDTNLPNIPPDTQNRVVRINDGNDSNVGRESVVAASKNFSMKFFNTAIPKDLEGFPAPVVLTLNPGRMTDQGWHKVEQIPKNLMFVRYRINTWNLSLCRSAVQFYTSKEVPVVFTFMAYFDTANKIPTGHQQSYTFRKRTLNSYWAITIDAWHAVMAQFEDNAWVHSCGREGISGGSACRHCGNCLREFFATQERMRATNV